MKKNNKGFFLAETIVVIALVTTVMAVISGCGFVRVHDVKENIRAVKMAEAIIKA